MLQAEPYLLATHPPSFRPRRQTKICFQLRTVRPSLSDWRFPGDASIVDQGRYVLRLGETPLALISAQQLDLPTMNRLVDLLRHSPPRRRKK